MTSSHPGPIHHTRTKIGTRQEGPPGSERGREAGSFPQPARNQHGGQRWGVSCSSASDGPTAVPGCSCKPPGLQRFQSGMKANWPERGSEVPMDSVSSQSEPAQGGPYLGPTSNNARSSRLAARPCGITPSRPPCWEAVSDPLHLPAPPGSTAPRGPEVLVQALEGAVPRAPGDRGDRSPSSALRVLPARGSGDRTHPQQQILPAWPPTHRNPGWKPKPEPLDP